MAMAGSDSVPERRFILILGRCAVSALPSRPFPECAWAAIMGSVELRILNHVNEIASVHKALFRVKRP